MRHLLFSSLLCSAVALQVGAQETTVTTDHKPNEHTVACLEAPTRDCAFTAALQTVIGEEFGIERAKVLIGVARSMIATGQVDQAKQTLMLALDEARSVRLTLVTQEKITVIAPLLARAGDVAAALALIEELQNDSIQDMVLLDVAEEAFLNGDVSDARVALRQMTNQTRAFWSELALLARAPKEALSGVSLPDLDSKVRELDRADRLYRGLIKLAVIADRKGEPGDRNAYIAEADELFSGVVGINARADVTADRVRSMYDAGLPDQLIADSYQLALLHGGRLRNTQDLADFSKKVGAVEAGRGDIDAAIRRVEYFTELDAKAAFLASLKPNENQSSFAVQVRQTLAEINDLQGAYERDIVRLTLLEGALSNADLYLARQVVAAMEDDDNQAFALALMAPLLD